MKCNKCLKIIPKGEEIRVYGGRSYTRDSHYGGCYCEPCFKESSEYRNVEGGGKSPKSSFPTWGVVLIIVAVLVIVGLLIALIIGKDEGKYDRW
jgi:hypothetical protein